MPDLPLQSAVAAMNQDKVILTASDGLAHVYKDSPLAKLNFFDGRYLRADDLKREQRYHEMRSELVARAGGAGVIHGLGIPIPDLPGAPLTLEPGLGFNQLGQPVLLPSRVMFDLRKLIEATAAIDGQIASVAAVAGKANFAECYPEIEPPTIEVPSANEPVYIITIAPNSALCGLQDVYGQLCESACVQGTASNLIVSGTILRARPVSLALPPVGGSHDLHSRSRLAAAWFRREALQRKGLISGAGLARPEWCGTANIGSSAEIPLAIVLLKNGAWQILDQWTVRRERMTVAPLTSWHNRMGMRGHEIFLGEVLQFQCQLSDILGQTDAAVATTMPTSSFELCAELIKKIVLTGPQQDELNKHVESYKKTKAAEDAAARRLAAPSGWLFKNGFVELPPAGFLPVDPSSGHSLRRQIAAHLGPMVPFRILLAPVDVIPHAFEEARDMRRIPLVPDLLTEGETAPEVEIFAADATVKVVREIGLQATHVSLHGTQVLQSILKLALPETALKKVNIFAFGDEEKKPSLALLSSVEKTNDGYTLASAGILQSEVTGPASAKQVVEAGRFVVERDTDAERIAVVELSKKGQLLKSEPSQMKMAMTLGVLDEADFNEITLNATFSLKPEQSDRGMEIFGQPLSLEIWLGTVDIEGHYTFPKSGKSEKLSPVSHSLALARIKQTSTSEHCLYGVVYVPPRRRADDIITDDGIKNNDTKDVVDNAVKDGTLNAEVENSTKRVRNDVGMVDVKEAGRSASDGFVGDATVVTSSQGLRFTALLGFASGLGENSYVPQCLDALETKSAASALDLLAASYQQLRGPLEEIPNGGILPTEKVGIGKLDGTGFDALLQRAAKANGTVGSRVRNSFEVDRGSTRTVMPVRDWVMFRRSRLVTEAPPDTALDGLATSPLGAPVPRSLPRSFEEVVLTQPIIPFMQFKPVQPVQPVQPGQPLAPPNPRGAKPLVEPNKKPG